MDVSRSMCSTDIAPSRLEAAKGPPPTSSSARTPAPRSGVVAFAGFGSGPGADTDSEALLDAVASLTTGRRTAIGGGILASIDAIAEIDPSVAPAPRPGRPGGR